MASNIESRFMKITIDGKDIILDTHYDTRFFAFEWTELETAHLSKETPYKLDSGTSELPSLPRAQRKKIEHTKLIDATCIHCLDGNYFLAQCDLKQKYRGKGLFKGLEKLTKDVAGPNLVEKLNITEERINILTNQFKKWVFNETGEDENNQQPQEVNYNVGIEIYMKHFPCLVMSSKDTYDTSTQKELLKQLMADKWVDDIPRRDTSKISTNCYDAISTWERNGSNGFKFHKKVKPRFRPRQVDDQRVKMFYHFGGFMDDDEKEIKPIHSWLLPQGIFEAPDSEWLDAQPVEPMIRCENQPKTSEPQAKRSRIL